MTNPTPDTDSPLGEALTFLKTHVDCMTGMCSRYLEPNGFYVPRDGNKWEGPQEDLDALFISDMIYMLDGPEQRKAWAAVDAALASQPAQKQVMGEEVREALVEGLYRTFYGCRRNFMRETIRKKRSRELFATPSSPASKLSWMG